MMHSQRELAKATCVQVEVMQQQLEVAKKIVSIMELQQQASQVQAEMAAMSLLPKAYQIWGMNKQKQLLGKLRKETDRQLD